MTDFEHEVELDDLARLRWMSRETTREKKKCIVKRQSLEFDGKGKLVRR